MLTTNTKNIEVFNESGVLVFKFKKNKEGFFIGESFGTKTKKRTPQEVQQYLNDCKQLNYNIVLS
jgi:hypothetical protein